MLDIVVKVDKY